VEINDEEVKNLVALDNTIEEDNKTKYKSVSEAFQGIGTTVAGMASGAVSATLGLPTDVVAAGVGIKDAILADDGKRMDAFSKGFTEVSKENMGSEYYKENFSTLLDSLIDNPVLKEDAKSGFSAGEFGGVGGVVAKAPKIAKNVIAQKETAREILSSLGLSSKAMKNINVDNMSVDGAVNLAKKLKVARAKLYGTDEQGNIGNAVMAMTAKRESSPVRQMAEAPPLEIGLNKFNLENPDKLLRNYSIDNFTKTEKVSGRSKSGLGSKGDKKINAPVEDGKEVSVRLNLNSKIDPDGPKEPFNHMQTIHPVVKGKPNYKQADSYKTAVSLENGTFHIDQNLRRMIAEDGMKVPAMSVQGKYTKNRNIFDEMDESVIEIGTNPRNSHLFVDLKTGQAVKGFDLATVFRDRVYAKGVTYWKKSDAPKPLSAKGDVTIDNQVRYKFKRGGLMART